MKFLSDILARAGLVVEGAVTLNGVANATTDTDKFIVLDAGVVKFRTGTEILSDIGGQALLTNPVTGVGSAGQVAFYSGASVITGDSSLFWDNTNKRLGVGTTTPYTNLQIGSGSGARYLGIVDTADTTYNIAYIGHNGTKLHIGFSNSNTSISERNAISINSADLYVGIGIATPANRLQIGSLGTTGFSGNHLAFGNGTAATAFFQASTSTQMYLSTYLAVLPSGSGTGNVVIGALASNGFRLEVVGTMKVTSTVTFDSIANATVDTDRFLVSDGGVIKYRTGAELLSDIGGISGNQNISFSGDISGNGTTTISTTVIGLRGAILPTTGTTAGFLRWTGATGTWVLDNTSYLTSYTETDTLATVTGRGATTSTVVTFSGGDGNNSSVKLAGYNQRGGVGFHGFLEATNTFGSATNPNKYFRLDSVGSLQIINNSYTVAILTLTDAGAFSVPGSATAGSFIRSGGTSSQFLKADGSVDSNTYLTSITSSQVTTALGYTPVPTSRTLTINGTTFDLSADRSWSITAGVSSVNAGSGISVSSSTGAVTVSNTGILSALAGSGISVSTSGGTLSISNTGLLSALAGSGISVSTSGGTLSISNTGILSGVAGSGISVSTSGGTLSISNTGLLSATAGSGISVSTSGGTVSISNTGVLSVVAGSGISVSTAGGTVTVSNTITNNNQLTNGAGYITSSALSSYLPLSGGTLTGALAGTSATFSSSVTTSGGGFVANMGSTNTEGLIIQRANTSSNAIIKFRNNASDTWILGNRNTGDETFRLYNYNLGSDVLTVTNNGNFVIGGTVASNVGLTIYGSNAATIYQTPNTGTGAANGFYVGHTGDISYVWNYNNFPLVLATNNTERLRITSGGNLNFNYSGATAYVNINQATSADGGLLFLRSINNRWQQALSTPGDNLLFYSYGVGNTVLSLSYTTGAATFISSVTAGGNFTTTADGGGGGLRLTLNNTGVNQIQYAFVSGGIAGDGNFALRNGSVGSNLLIVTQTGQLRLNTYTSSSAWTGTAVATLAVDSSGNVITVAGGGGSSQWVTTGSDIYYATGNVGIGSTASPTTRLDVRLATTDSVNGTVLNSYPIASFIANGSGGGTRGLQIGAPTGGVVSPVFLKVFGTSARFAILNQSNVENFTVLEGGNVGINTLSPTHQLSLQRSAEAAAYQINLNVLGGISTGNFTGIRFSQDSTASTELGNIRLHYFTSGATALSLGTRYATQAIYIDNTTDGKVGIGTTTPSNRLHVSGSGTVGRFSSTSGTAGVTIAHSGNGGEIGYTNLGAGNQSNVFYITTGAGTVGSGLVIDNGGNVGIGTTSFSDVGFASPALKVAGSRATLGLTSSGTLATIAMIPANNTNAAIHLNQSSDGSFRLYQYSVGAETFVLAGNGNVGIGATSPTSPLHISAGGGDGSAILRIAGSASDLFNWASSTIYPNLTAGENVIHLTGKAQSQFNSGYFGFRQVADNSSSNMVTLGLFAADNLVNILGNGNVGIGTVSPNHRLDVNGDINIPGGNKLVFNNEPTGWYIHARTTTSTTNLGSALKNIIISGGGSTEGFAFTGVGTGATAMEVRNDGRVWVRENLNVGGTITESSTIKIKENIAPVTAALDKVDQLKPVSYNKKGSTTKEIGLIAEDVFDIYPEFVLCDDNGEPVGVHYSRLTAVLIESVKELKNKITELEKRN